MSLIDTYQIATCGQNLTDTYTLASNGILIRVEIQDLPDIEIPGDVSTDGIGSVGGGVKKKKVTRRKIIVTAKVDGKEYCEEVIVEDKPTLKVEDVGVEVVTENNKPKIKVTLSL